MPIFPLTVRNKSYWRTESSQSGNELLELYQKPLRRLEELKLFSQLNQPLSKALALAPVSLVAA